MHDVQKVFDDMVVWALTGVIGAGLWVARKVFGMNQRIGNIEAVIHEAKAEDAAFKADYKESEKHKSAAISLMQSQLATMSADLRNNTKNTDRILELLERR